VTGLSPNSFILLIKLIKCAMKFSTEAIEDGFRVTIEFEVKHWNDLVDQVKQFIKMTALDD